jgi:AAA domain/Bifunctional DNA primase/polymerase, N-terminal/Primase C terminal 1 (PriCT-1)
VSGYATALEFAAYGFPVVPVKGKVPLVGEGGLHNASFNPDTLLAWHNRFPDAGWAVVCGHGFCVVDVDAKHGGDVQEVLLHVAGPMVETGQANGNGRGLHVYVAGNMRGGQTALKGVEVRGFNQIAVIPGSPHSSGVSYEWVGDQRPWTPGALAPLPPELAPRRPERVVVNENGRIPYQKRNDTLTSLAGTMRARGMCTKSIHAALHVVAEEQCDPAPPGEELTKRELEQITRSAGSWAPGELPETSPGFAARLTDLPRLVAQPPTPVPWVVEGIAAGGKLTVLSGAADIGKSWLAIACAYGVGTGEPVAGILPCVGGRALYLDAEMGRDEFSGRVRGLGLSGHELDHLDAAGLDLAKKAHLAEVAELVGGYTFVVLDSLRSLAPGMRENESDSVAPVVSAIRNLARKTGAAILLLHHRGKSGDEAYRGSSAVKDQSDALLSMWPGNDDTVVALRCRGGKGRVRFAAAPEDVWLQRSPFTGRLSQSVAREIPEPESAPIRAGVRELVLEALPAKSMREVARMLGRGEKDRTVSTVWKELRDSGEIVQVAGFWQGSASMPPFPSSGGNGGTPGGGDE